MIAHKAVDAGDQYLHATSRKGGRLSPLQAALCGSRLTRNRLTLKGYDPPRADGGSTPAGWGGLAYFRFHGSPRMYYSSYGDDFLDALAVKLQDLRRRRIPTWCIFDNTALGAGTGNALSLIERLE